jgi:Conjugative transposon protein TcpC
MKGWFAERRHGFAMPSAEMNRRERVRAVGRAVLWGFIALVFVRGLSEIAKGAPQSERNARTPAIAPAAADDERRAFAIAFAQSYLAVPARPVARFFSAGLRDQASVSVSPHGPGVSVTQATVAREVRLGGSRALLTVAASLSNGRIVYLSVPIARDAYGGLSVDDLPSFSAPPPPGTAPTQAPPQLVGTERGSITDLVGRFLRAYLDGGDAEALSYFLAPGAAISPMAPGLQFVGLDELDDEGTQGETRLVSAIVGVRDGASGAVYTMRYRLTLVHRDRWCVVGVAGGPHA